MLLTSHLCLLTDGTLARLPHVYADEQLSVARLDLSADKPAEIGGMAFVAGVIVCGLPSDFVGVTTSSPEDFCSRMAAYGVGVGRGPLAVLAGPDLTSFSGCWTVSPIWRRVCAASAVAFSAR